MSRSISKNRAIGAGIAATLAAAALVGVAGSASAAAPGAAGVATPALGTNAGGNVVSVVGTGFRDAITNAVAIETPKVVLGTATTAAVCSTAASGVTWASPVWSAVSATRLTVTMPAGTVPAAAASIKAAICFKARGGTTWTTIPYTFAKPVTAPDADLFTPASGPMSGGQTVNLVARTGNATTAYGIFQAGSTVLVGSVPALAVKPAGTSLSFVTPVSSSSGAQTITVRTPGFPDYKILPGTAGAGGGYKSVRAISVSPAFGPTDEATSILVQGAGFLSDAYGDADGDPATPAKSLHVYLSDGKTFTAGATPTAAAVAVEPAECANLQIISDTELSCDVPAATSAENTAGAAAKPFTVIVTDNDWAGTLTPDSTDAADAIVTGSAHTPAVDSAVSRSAIFVRADF